MSPGRSPQGLRFQFRPRPARGDPAGQRGSAVVLVPAGFLVLVVLAAITVDSAVAFLGQRQLNDALSAAANDAAGAAISASRFYQEGQLVLDPARAASVVCQTVAGQSSGLHRIRLSLALDGAVVGVRGSAEVDEVFGRALPGLRQRQVSALATAVAVTGPVGTATGTGTGLAASALTNYQPLSCSF
ncbi:MAG: hypothetical protein ACRDY0_09130 [Acidimicrobiales bacterium]